MREEFYENSAVPQNQKGQKILYTVYNIVFYLSIISLVFFLYMFFLFGDKGFLLLCIFPIALGVPVFFIKRKFCTCFDYTFISGEVRIVKVINGKARKKFLFFDSRDVYQLGKVGSESFEKVKVTPSIKTKMATPNGYNTQNQLYYVAITLAGEKMIVIMECEEKFLSYIVSYTGKQIIEKDYAN